MRRVVALLVACTPHAAGAAALVSREQAVQPGHGNAAASGATAVAALEDIHQPFTSVLSNVRASLTNATQDIETVEQIGPGSLPASQLREHTENALHEIKQVLGLPSNLFTV